MTQEINAKLNRIIEILEIVFRNQLAAHNTAKDIRPMSGEEAAKLILNGFNSFGKRVRREEIIYFVESHWPPCTNENEETNRFVTARRVAVCAIDLDRAGEWERLWKPKALQSKSFGFYCDAFVKNVVLRTGITLVELDKAYAAALHQER